MNKPVRTALLLGGVALCSLLLPALLLAQNDKPIRVGLSIAQTGPLTAAGKSGLLALQIWRDDVNARGGLLGRPVELIVYDDQGNAALTPGIYTKLLDHRVLARHIREHEINTIVGPIRYGPTGGWANPRIVYVQFRGIADKDLAQFRRPGKQVIVAPTQFKTGEVQPFNQARK